MQAMPFTKADARLGNWGTGAMFFSIFGAVWLIAWASSVHAGTVWFAAIVVMTALLFGAALQRYRRDAPLAAGFKDSPERRRAKRIFNIVNAVQWTVIVVLAQVLRHTGHEVWIMPMAIGIIGLHFYPLAVLFRNPTHYLTGSAMLALAILYPLLAGPASPIGLLGAGIILWLSAAWSLRPGRMAAAP